MGRQVPAGGVHPWTWVETLRTSRSPSVSSMKQWSANWGTSISATRLRVSSTYSELASRSPMRSSRPKRSFSRSLLRIASRAVITMPVTEPEG